ncbi:hypothetical protein B0H15DRAFT_851912 [Mycena belliarum]|uniref:Chromo domain-containing protein n=1 Tax=Mycena belliarum TaxID=1033014 RepID=A0AAD6U0N5_9AGAR|nr:hypothetical protein B0H15DRAFT_851912 [Mycena belliae]
MSGEEEFFVSKVIGAKVEEAAGGKSEKKWVYLTEWADYPYEATWEPEHHFNGTKWAIQSFWEKMGPKYWDHRVARFNSGVILSLPQIAIKRKPGPGRSSEGLISGTRVFALWHETQKYYAAVVQRRKGEKYQVRFEEDGSQSWVARQHLRPCAKLRKGDTVVLKSTTAQVSEIKPDGSIKIAQTLNFDNVVISAWDVEAQWGDRRLTHRKIVYGKET